jgi:hypothetical protein
MSNELQILEALEQGLERVTAVELNRGAAGGLPILKLTKGGNWEYGKEGIEPDEATVWAWQPMSMQHGYVSWGDGAKCGEWMAPISVKLMAMEDLPPTNGDAWQIQFATQLQAVTGADKGELVLYVGTSSGLKDAFDTMVKAILTQLRAKLPAVPLVKLSTSHYVHKKYGKIHKPEFEILAWVTPGASEEDIGKALAV